MLYNIWKHRRSINIILFYQAHVLELLNVNKFVEKIEGIPQSRKDLTGGPFLSHLLGYNLLPFMTG